MGFNDNPIFSLDILMNMLYELWYVVIVLLS